MLTLHVAVIGSLRLHISEQTHGNMESICYISSILMGKEIIQKEHNMVKNPN